LFVFPSRYRVVRGVRNVPRPVIHQSQVRWNIMQTYIKNRRRLEPRLETLEGKTLLSAGALSHQAAHHVITGLVVAQAAPFSGTLTGSYSNVHIPFAGYLLNYATSGSLTGVGSTHLHGSIFARPGARSGHAAGQFVMRNGGGLMIANVFKTPTTGTYSYKVIRATGSDSAYRGGTGTVAISQNPTRSFPYFVSGQATMTFTPS
jgi:hypothetical protein